MLSSDRAALSTVSVVRCGRGVPGLVYYTCDFIYMALGIMDMMGLAVLGR
jgi:hypothetical protein